ncbi:MBL fold metallo-hydrolase [Vibrio parahaemolyticus]
MNNWFYIVLIVLVTLIFYRVLPLLYLGVTATNVTRKMKHTCLPTGKLGGEVWVAKDGHANVFFVKDGSGYIAIDAGDSPEKLISQMAKINIKPEEVHTVLLTHSDIDHVGAISAFNHADIYIAAAEVPLIDGSGQRTFTRHRIKFNNKLKASYHTLEDGQTLKTQSRDVECTLTPGHTPGSMCFLIDGKYLFTGDTVKLVSGKFQPFVEIFTMDTAENAASIHKLAQLVRQREIYSLYTAYYGYTDNLSYAAEGW